MALPSMPRGPDARGKRVALFGLSADPPTGPRGHQGLVRRLAGEGLFDEIWWAPLSPPSHPRELTLTLTSTGCFPCTATPSPPRTAWRLSTTGLPCAG
jgi:hypothetical protein